MLVDGRWVPTFPNARYVFTQPEFEYWQATSYPDGDDIFGDSVAPIVDAGRADLVPVDHRLDAGIRLDSTPGPHAWSRVGRHRVRGGAGGHHRRHDPHADPDRRASTSRRRSTTTSAAAADTRRDFLDRYADGALVIGTHWGGPGAGRIRADGDGRWSIEPAPAPIGTD